MGGGVRRLGRGLAKRFRPSRFLRGEGPEDGPITLDRSRVFVMPTRSGLGFAAALLVMLLGSMNYANNAGIALTLFLASLALVSIFHTYRNLAQLTFRSGGPGPVFAGQKAGFPVGVQNPSRRPRQDICVRRGAPDGPILDIPEGNSSFLVFREAERRGLLGLGRFSVESRFPLGLFRAWSHLEFRATCLVYPKPGLPGPWRPEGQDGEAASGDKRRGQEDFSGLRTYRPGDPLRHIHWKASARSGELLSKEFSGSGQGEVWLDWEDFPELDVEARLSRLCRLTLDAHAAGGGWGMRLPGAQIDWNRGQEHLHRCLAALAVFPSDGGA